MNEAKDLVAAVENLVTENDNLKRKCAHEISLKEAHLERIMRLQAVIANLKRDNAVVKATWTRPAFTPTSC